MSELISGKEAKVAWANGLAVQVDIGGGVFGDITSEDLLSVFDYTTNKFRIKPRTITINSIEVPAPFDPKEGDYVYFICSDEISGYAETTLRDTPRNCGFVQFGAWRTEAEIKQVVAALRKVFKGG